MRPDASRCIVVACGVSAHSHESELISVSVVNAMKTLKNNEDC